MKDDYYILDTRAHKYVGELSAKTYQMGDLIRVRLEQVNMLSKRITFALSEEDKEKNP